MLLKIYFSIIIFTLLKLNCVQCTEEMLEEGVDVASSVIVALIQMFDECCLSTMPDQKFILDNIEGFVNHPSKTTVGYAPKFTSNRKFFANMLTTTAFKEMLANDLDKMSKDTIRKYKYCDELVMKPETMKELYDHTEHDA